LASLSKAFGTGLFYAPRLPLPKKDIGQGDPCMRAIFISYRREDAEGQAGRLFDDLVKLFGEQSVFMDVAAIEPGRDFRKAIDEHVASCGVLLALMGKNWVDARDQAGRRRLDDPLDFVRLETAAALKRDIPVVPVLVHGASMPRADQLPADLADLAFRNAIELTHARWNSDLTVLGKALSRYVTPSQPDTAHRGSIERGTQTFAPQSQIQRRLVMAIVIATILVLGAAGVYFLKPPTPVPASAPVQSSPRVEAPPRIDAPTIAFSANPPSIKAGESTELRWSATNAWGVTIPNVVDRAPESGSTRVSPTDTTTYTAIARGRGGEKTEWVKVEVQKQNPLATAKVQIEKPNPPAAEGIVGIWDVPNTTDTVHYIIRRVSNYTYTIQFLRFSSFDWGTDKLTITQGNETSLIGLKASAVIRRNYDTVKPPQPGREDVIYLQLEWKTPDEAFLTYRFESYQDGSLHQKPILGTERLVRRSTP
jgi:hypothetical protein